MGYMIKNFENYLVKNKNVDREEEYIPDFW